MIHKNNNTLNEIFCFLKSALFTYSNLYSHLALFCANLDLVTMILSPILQKTKNIHIIKNLDGFITVPNNQFVGLVKMTFKSFPILIPTNIIGTNLDMEVPLVSDIKNV